MKCERLDHLLPAYIDGDLPGGLNRRVSDHLDACERCRRALAEQQRVLRLLDTGRRPVSIDLWPDFARRLQRESLQAAPQPRGFRSLLTPVSSAHAWFRRSPLACRHLWQPALAAACAAATVALVAHSAPTGAPQQWAVAHRLVAIKMAQVPESPAAGRDLIASAASIAVEERLANGRGAHRAHSDRADPSIPASLRQEITVTASRMAARAGSPAISWRAKGQSERRQEAGGGELVPSYTATPHAMRRLRRPFVVAADLRSRVASTAGEHHGTSRNAWRPALSTGQPPAPAGTSVAGGWRETSAATLATLHPAPSDAAGPLDAAEALAAVQQDAANEQVKGELLLMAQEVARLGGAFSVPASSPDRAPSPHAERT
jgi:anti-sigma factor RsiW